MNILSVISLLYIIGMVYSLCRMKQECEDMESKDCMPQPANDTMPVILNGPDVQCHEYTGQLACCSNDQNKLILKNFNSLDSIFGYKGDGCDICLINLKRFWCHFTCSPDQDTFSI